MTAKQETGPWDAEVDVVVVGFGGAGVCAALEEAKQGASVLLLDRCHGGGSTAASVGVIYAGGGTPYQKADVDSPPRYTPPPWEAKEVSFVEMKNIFVRSKPDVDFLKDGAIVPLLLTS